MFKVVHAHVYSLHLTETLKKVKITNFPKRDKLLKAARFYDVRKPLKVEDVEIPKIDHNEALIRIRACGICHTDLHFIDEGILKPGKTPLTMGHEAAGDVVEVGKDVKNIKVGDRVLIHFYFSCGECYYCQLGRESLCISPNFRHFGFTVDGGFAEYAKAPARNLIKLPDEAPYEAGILADAGSSSYHAVKEIGKVKLGENIVIMGTGGLGLCALQFAKLSGARVIAVDIVEEKLKVAEELGADVTINAKGKDVAEEVKRLTNGDGVDIVFEFVGRSQTMESAITSLRRGGRLVFVGYSEDLFKINTLKLVWNELQVLGSRASSRRETVEVIKLLQEGKFKLKPLITHTVPLSEINYGLDLLRRDVAIRVVVKP
jgi:2-desacetyl-2-hydroxyethyl bacteriochlorophyllide A dehydrogenase